MRIATLAFVTLVVVLSRGVLAAEAATITVGGACTLVDAINAANADATSGGCTGGAITGVFAPGGADTIELTGTVTLGVAVGALNGPSGLPVVLSDITINGNGHTIQRNLAFACPGGANPDFRIVEINSGAHLELNDVTLRNGCVTGAAPGGAGGAILLRDGSLAVNRSTIRNNTTATGGGGLALLPVAGKSVTATVIDSAFVDNAADFGGASHADGSDAGSKVFLTYISSTLTGNTATASGGALDDDVGSPAESTTLVSSSTVAGNTAVNQGNGLNIVGSATVQFANSIIANAGPGAPTNCRIFASATIISSGHNLATDFSCQLTGPGDLPGTPSGLGPLISVATPGKTHVPLSAGSGAINSGDSCPPTDQLGLARLGACDRGAIESGVFTVVTLPALKDSSLLADDVHTNEGANTRLHLRVPGKRRVVVGFDLSAVDLDGVVRARLVLTIAANSNNWTGSNNLVDAHPLLADFTEGNGSVVGVPAPNRGSGAGVTWKCATDTNIANTVRNCATVSNGGLFDAATAPGVAHSTGLLGDVEWDVTTDVLAGQELWLIKKRKEGALQPGGVRYHSREGSLAAFGDLSRAPRLILELR